MTIKKERLDFLESLPQNKYKLIVINPPWKKLGIEFIKKSIKALVDGGQLICVMDYNKFTTKTLDKYSFFNLQKLGHFDFVSCESSRGPSYFAGVADSVYFVFTKTHKPKGETTIKNRLHQTFKYQLKGNEFYVPQIPNEDDFFDWKNGIIVNGCGSTSTWNEDKIAFKIRKKESLCVFQFVPKGEQVEQGGAVISANLVDFNTLKTFLLKNKDIIYDHYTVSHGWHRIPPIKKGLVNDC